MSGLCREDVTQFRFDQIQKLQPINQRFFA